eukprot:Platyproteum_vivax@DN15975_c0_g1_i1.p1
MLRAIIASVGFTAFACFLLMKIGAHETVNITLPQPLLDKLSQITSGLSSSSSSVSSRKKNVGKCIDESGGFYDDYNDDEWSIKLEAMQRLIPRQEMNAAERYPYGHAFYASIY